MANRVEAAMGREGRAQTCAKDEIVALRLEAHGIFGPGRLAPRLAVRHFRSRYEGSIEIEMTSCGQAGESSAQSSVRRSCQQVVQVSPRVPSLSGAGMSARRWWIYTM